MNKKAIVGFLLILLLGWIAGASYYFVCKIQNRCEASLNPLSAEEKNGPKLKSQNQEIETEPVSTFKITDGEFFSSESTKNVSFSSGKSDLLVPEEIAGSFASINEYLSNNPDKKLTLNGLFTLEEKESIGKKRAEAIANYLTDNYGIDYQKIIISSKSQNKLYIDNETKRIQGGVEFGFESPIIEEGANSSDLDSIEKEKTPKYVSEKTLSIDPSKYEKVLKSIRQKKNIYYPPSGFDIEPNITSDLKTYFKNLQLYFSENPHGLLKITGYSDNNKDNYTNSIISRRNAEKMKYYLINEYGLKDRNIKTSGRGSSKLNSNNPSNIEKAQNRKITFSIIK